MQNYVLLNRVCLSNQFYRYIHTIRKDLWRGQHNLQTLPTKRSNKCNLLSRINVEKKSHKSYDPISNRGYTEMEAYGDLVLIGSSVAIWKQLSNTSDAPKYEDINENVDEAVFEDVGIFFA